MLDLFNPVHNLKEICKEFVLLEDHLSAPEKRCPDCIRKHLLKAEAFAEEAIALDKTGEHLPKTQPLPGQIRAIQKSFLDGANDHSISQQVRKIRKKLSPYCFGANLQSGKKKRKTKGKPNAESRIRFTIDIANGMGISNQEKKKFIKALVHTSNPRPPFFRFPAKGITARVRNSSAWIKARAIELLSKGQILKMMSRTKTNGSEFTEQQYQDAVRHAFGLGTPAHLDTPSSSIGEYLQNQNIRKSALKNALEQGYEGSLRRISSLTKKETLNQRKIADIYTYVAKNTKDPYFFVQAAVRYGKIGDKKMEARSFKQVLAMDKNHQLKFWLGNKAIIADRISSIEEFGKDQQESSPAKRNTMTRFLLPFAFGAAMGWI